MAASTIPAARAYVAQAFTTACAGFTDPIVQVFTSMVDHDTATDVVVIGGARRRIEQLGIVGNLSQTGAFKETYSLGFTISCADPGDTFDAVDARAYAVLDACEQAIRADGQLGGLAITARPSVSNSAHTYSQNGAAICEITATLDVLASI